MNVLLIGMKHCGKSTLGRQMAARLGCPFYDVDPMIEAMHECEHSETLPVREIFAQYGERHFHRIEGHVVCELYLKLDRPGSSSVVSLGGRTALNETVCRLLSAIGRVIYLQVAPETLFERVIKGGVPPFLDPANPREDFLALCRQREPEYERLADVTVNLDGLSIEAAAERLAGVIEEQNHVRQ